MRKVRYVVWIVPKKGKARRGVATTIEMTAVGRSDPISQIAVTWLGKLEPTIYAMEDLRTVRIERRER